MSIDNYNELPNITNYPEYYGAVGDGITDDTSAFQQMVNLAGVDGTTLIELTAGKIYKLNVVYLPLGRVIIRGKGTVIKNTTRYDVNSSGVFILNMRRINSETGIYKEGPASDTEENNVKIAKGIEISDITFDGQFKPASLLAISASEDYETVHDIKINNIVAKNITSYAVIRVNSSSVITSNEPAIQSLTVENSSFFNLGVNLKVRADANYAVGTTSLKIKSGDIMVPLSDKILVGDYITFSSIEKRLSSTVGKGTASVYRIESFIKNEANPSLGDITIASGKFDRTFGFIKDAINEGLKTPVISNAYVFIPDNYSYGSLHQLPKFNTTINSKVFTRADTSSELENARANNLYIGRKIIFRSGGRGYYTITKISPNEIEVDTKAIGTFNNVQATSTSYLADAVSIKGYIKNVYITNNYISGANHLLRSSGTQIKSSKRMIDIPTSITVSNNTIEYCWMGWEEQTGGNVNPGINNNSLGVCSVTKDSNRYKIDPTKLISISLNDKIYLTDIDIEKEPTAHNSLMIGDIIRFDNCKGLYEVTEIPLDIVSNPYILCTRYNSNINITEGGFLHDAELTGQFSRTYSSELGTKASVGTLNFLNNKYSQPIRSSGGGYAISITAGGFLNVYNNHIEASESIAFEIFVEHVNIENNIIHNKLFTGQDNITGGNLSSVRSAGRPVSISSGNIKIKGNTFNFDKENDFTTAQSGSILLGGVGSLNTTLNTFLITDNKFNNVSDYIIFGGNVQNSDGTLSLSWDVFEFNNNYVTVSENANYNRPFPIMGKYSRIYDNVITYLGESHEAFFRTEQPNSLSTPEWSIHVRDNYFSKPLISSWGAAVVDKNITT